MASVDIHYWRDLIAAIRAAGYKGKLVYQGITDLKRGYSEADRYNSASTDTLLTAKAKGFAFAAFPQTHDRPADPVAIDPHIEHMVMAERSTQIAIYVAIPKVIEIGRIDRSADALFFELYQVRIFTSSERSNSSAKPTMNRFFRSAGAVSQ